jgi:DNA-binding winged helix-turn-helix (wHTH) protein/tetratricopeptide (TPR) repeat protein/TolB-like protein
MVLRFAGFELDQRRAELRGPHGEAIKLRPKTLGILILLTANAGRVVTKQELMDAVWPNIHVGDDSLFQCIRELRTALGDDQRELIRLVSGRGYLFTPDVSIDPATTSIQAPSPVASPAAEASVTAETAPPWQTFGLRRPAALAIASLGMVVALAIVTTMVWPGALFGRRPPVIAVMPIAAAGGDGEVTAMAANLTTRLADGLAKIENIRVSAPRAAQPANGAPQADFVVSGELQKSERSWEVRARMVRPATGEVVWSTPVSVELEDIDLPMQHSRLAAGVGHPLALRIGTLLKDARSTAASRGSPPGSSHVAIEQATASIVQTTRERFATAQAMLEKALADDPDNVDLAVTLAALQLRGVQMVWYSPDESAAAQVKARSILERALRVEPDSIPVLEAYCRFLNATNEFVDSLVACARTLNFDPWDGLALYHIGLAQLQLGRFEDALATFKQADNFGTPQVSRWTWKLGAGWTYLMMDRSADALPWLQSSIAITPASGRSYMLLAAAYEGLGQSAEAKNAMEKGLTLRPGSNVSNVAVPRRNASAAFVAAAERIERTLVAVGLPEH